MNDTERITRLEEARSAMEKRLDANEKDHRELRIELRKFAEKNDACHRSIKKIVAEAHATLGVIDAKLEGISRVFWLLVAAIVTSSVGVVIAMIIRFGGKG